MSLLKTSGASLALLALLLLNCSATSSSRSCPQVVTATAKASPLTLPTACAVAPLVATPRSAPAATDKPAPTKPPLTLDTLARLESKPHFPFCSARLSPELAEVLYQTAERLIVREDEHVSTGALETILPLLRLAAYSGHRKAQRRYGFYVVGYYETDEMFWPHDKETAADALGLLHVLAVDFPEDTGESRSWIIDYKEPTDANRSFPAEWVRRAKQVEAEYRKCNAPVQVD